METIRICRQCSRRLPIERFRYLRGERKTEKRGRQHTCMDCDSLNALFRRLDLKETLTEKDQVNYDKCVTIYKAMFKTNPNCNLPKRVKESLGIGAEVTPISQAENALDTFMAHYGNTTATPAPATQGSSKTFSTPDGNVTVTCASGPDQLTDAILRLSVDSTPADIDNVIQMVLDINPTDWTSDYLKHLANLENTVDVLARKHPNLDAADKLQELCEELFSLG